MLALSVPSATFDERLIQRSGSGETDNSSSNSGLATPQDEGVQPLGSMIDLKQASKAIATSIDRDSSLKTRKEYEGATEEIPTLGNEGGTSMGDSPIVMTRMIPSGSSSSVPESPDFEEPEVTHMKAKNVYTLPNRHISIEMQEHDDPATSDMVDLADEFAPPTMGLNSLLYKKWTKEELGKGALLVLLFLPWCVAVGASIVLCPNKLDTVTFRTGYLEPLSGIHRFAHWADRSFEHMVIFGAFIGLIIWFNSALGVALGCVVGALAINAWHDFKLDPTIPLGEDDRQSIYLSITKFWLTDEFLNLRRQGNGYVLDQTRGEKKTDVVDDSEGE